MRTYRYVMVAAALTYVSGCSTTSKVANVFDDLVNETHTTSTYLLSHKSILSISGLAPARLPGSFILHVGGDLSPTHAIGVSPKWSYVFSSTYELDDRSPYPLVPLVTKYRELLELSRALAAGKVELIAIDASIKKPDRAAACTLLEIKPATECTDAKVTQSRAEKNKKITEQDEKLKSAKNAFEAAANGMNAITMRWQRTTSDAAGAKYGSYGRVGYDSQHGKSGLAFYGDIRVSSLYFGEDFLDLLADYSEVSKKWIFTRSGIPTYVVQAKHIQYVSDEDERSRFEMGLKVSQLQIKALEDALGAGTDATELIAEYTTALVSDIGNNGRLSNPAHSVRPYCFFPTEAHQDQLWEETGKSQKYSTIYEVRSQLSFLASLGLSTPPTDLEKLVKTHANGDKEKLRTMLLAYSERCKNYDEKAGPSLQGWRTTDEPFLSRLIGRYSSPGK